MGRRLNAELWDKMHYLFRDFNDRMVHLELHYDFEINLETLKTVLICFFEKAPVLHSRFVDNKVSPYWEVMPYRIEDVITVKHSDNVTEDIDRFLTQYIPPERDLQMKVGVFYYEGKTALCMVENHMCMDGGDFKYFIRSFCKAYSEYEEKGISPINLREGTRSYDSVYTDFSKTQEKMARNLYRNVCAKDTHKFPLTESKEGDRSFIARRRISEETFLKLKTVGKAHGATVNDMLVAAYFYSLYELAGYGEDESVTISCAIDLRRHMKDDEGQGVTNHTAFMQCNIPRRGRNIFETLQYVINSSNLFKKDKFMGLYGLPLLKFAYKILPHSASEEIIKIGYSNPLLAMSNIGILDHKALALGGNEPIDGFMTGAVKYKPYVLLSATSMRNVITLSMCVRGNEDDKKIVNTFFDIFERSIEKLLAE
ncbi:MAG: hypothetical protein IKY78_05955 [Clostridia bacterium]|nr:hypothetical protein [Clostridia bacterium]